MTLTMNELKHIKNVEWGLKFWSWFRWVMLAMLAYTATRSWFSWGAPVGREWLLLGVGYLLVAWPGLCRSYVFHALKRIASADPQTRQQLIDAGISPVDG